MATKNSIYRIITSWKTLGTGVISTNDIYSPITSKGDLISSVNASVAPVSTRIPVGPDNSILSTNPIRPSVINWEASGVNTWVSRAISGNVGIATTNRHKFPITYGGGVATTSTLTADRLVCLPFHMDRAWYYGAIGMVCQTSVASSTVRLGIYDASGTGGFPGSLILDAGTISTASTGTLSINIEQNIYGKYWLVYIASHTPTMNGYTISQNEFSQALGRPDTATGTDGWFVYEDGVSSYLSALPASLASDTFTIGASTRVAFVYLGNGS